MPHLSPDTTLQGGKYKIVKTLGQGGFGITYLAIQTNLNRRVAIKEFFMKEFCERNAATRHVTMGSAGSRETVNRAREKFQKEANRIAQFDHPHIVRITDLFDENGTSYYVMEYAGDESLSDRLKRNKKPMGEAELMRLLPQILDALEYIHSAGIWHLDLKPANIMIDAKGNVRLIDFGASKQMKNASGVSLSTSSSLSYSAGYAPSEQLEQNFDKFGPWTDLYALGATMYNLLTRRQPPSPSEIIEDPQSALALPGVSDKTRRLIALLMKPNRKERPQNVQEVRAILDEAKSASSSSGTSSLNKPALGVTSRQETNDDTIVIKPRPMPQAGPESTSKFPKRKAFIVTVSILAVVIISMILASVRGCGNGSVGATAANDSSYNDSAILTESVIILLFLFCLSVMGVMGAMGQNVIKRKKCSSCGKVIAQCPYRGKHPTPQPKPQPTPEPKPKPQSKPRTVSASNQNCVLRVGNVSYRMINVYGGTFTMGATSEMTDPYDNEKPTHQVTLSSYYIGETEVTQALWKAVMGYNPSEFKGDNLPVEKVSWDDCQEFIRKLNAATGRRFRLPTEAEWEFAARGGNQSRRTQYSGSSNIDDVAWYDGNSGNSTHPVKTKRPNELGLYDMSGNVWEWCQDWYGSYTSYSQTNPTGPNSGSDRVIRGGSWTYYKACICRSSYRLYRSPGGRDYDLGFRLALSE